MVEERVEEGSTSLVGSDMRAVRDFQSNAEGSTGLIVSEVSDRHDYRVLTVGRLGRGL